MNYNSVHEIVNANTSNMLPIQTSGIADYKMEEPVKGADWLFINEENIQEIYVNRYSAIGFEANSINLKVNYDSGKDRRMNSIYREEGTLYNYYRFLKIRWDGYSDASATSYAYRFSYAVIFWETGDISLCFGDFPSKQNNGTYSFNDITYTVSSSQTNVTFKKNTSGNYEVSYNIIDFPSTIETRYLIRSNNKYYNVLNENLSEIEIENLTSENFLTYGMTELPSYNLINTLENPEILYWAENQYGGPKEGLVITGAPSLPQIVYFQDNDLSLNTAIEKAEVFPSQDALFSISFDEGLTWKYHNGTEWQNASLETEGMSANTIKNLTIENWNEVFMPTILKIRCCLPTIDSYTSNFYFKTI